MSIEIWEPRRLQKQGLGQRSKNSINTTNDIVVFGGTSAGAVAAMVHIEHVAETLKKQNVSVLGYLDSPMYYDTEPMNPKNNTGLNERLKTAFYAFNESNLVPKDCAKQFDKENQWKCIYPEYRLKYVKTPFILIADQFDDYALGMALGIYVRNNFTQEQRDYAMKFAEYSKKYA